MVGVQLMLGAWHHTSFIPRIKWFEWIFNSPSLHRVHHGVQDKYLDKNFAEVFCLWDRLFGTFQEEEETPSYGMLNQPTSYRMSAMNWHFYKVLIRASLITKKWSDKILLWIMPLGRFPSDVPKRKLVMPSREHLPADILNRNGRIRLIVMTILNTLILLPVINTQNDLALEIRLIGIVTIWLMAILAGRACDGMNKQYHLEGIKFIFQVTWIWLAHTKIAQAIVLIQIALVMLENVLLGMKLDRTDVVNNAVNVH
jgi:hypothetical protein